MIKNILIVLSVLFISTSCTVSHNHYTVDDNYIKNEVIDHSFIDKGNHLIIIMKHKHQLNKRQKQKIRRWCQKHYHHHKKRIKFKFIVK